MTRKNIDLSDKVKEKLSIQAIKKGTNLKNYIEWFLEKLAHGKGVKLKVMKELSDGTRVNAMTYYFLLDWNDKNNKKFISEQFKKQRLVDLTIDEYMILWLNATTNEYNKLVALANER